MFPKVPIDALPDHLRWRCDTIEPGTEVTGLIAGPLVVVRTHWNGSKTLPCLHSLTNGALFCPCTARAMRGATTGYCPIINRNRDRLVVPTSALVAYELEKQNPGKLVTLARSVKRCAPLRIILSTPTDQQQDWVRRLRESCIHSIEEYLLHLWQIPSLNEHFGIPFRPAVGSVVESK